MSNKTECMIRLDDITPDMNMERFHRVKEVLDKYQICPLIGVVPQNRDETLHKVENDAEFWNLVKELQNCGWKVAQHGTYHVYETSDSGLLGINPFSEFAGLSYDIQLEKIQTGKKILEDNGIATDIFMAPGHTFDNNTLKALVECGFKVVTDGLYKKPYYEKGLLFVPCRLRGFKKPDGIDTVCLHTNLMDEQDVKALETFCRNNREVIVDFDAMRYREFAAQRTFAVRMSEKIVLFKRQIKDKIANSKRLVWYMERTNHGSSKVKWVKRMVCLPMLLFYKENK